MLKVPEVEYRGGVYYLTLDAASPGDRGLQHGTALRLPIRTAIRQFRRWISGDAGLDDPAETVSEFVKESGHLRSASELAPDLVEEMEGVAEGAGVDMVELFTYQSFDEFFMYLISSGALDFGTNGHCTTAAVAGRAGLPNLVAHNNDIPTYHEGLVTVAHIKSPGAEVEILQSTFAGQLGQNGVNSAGVGVGINTIADLPGGSGLPVSFHVRRILECTSVEAAEGYLRSASFGQAMNYMIADRNTIVSVETWPGDIAALRGDEGFLAHTNHSLAPYTPRTFQMSADSGGGSYGLTRERLDLANATLSAQAPSITLAGFKELFGTRPILVHPGKPTGRTIMSMVAEIPAVGSPVLHITPDTPSLYPHAQFTFD